ncbi:hypothetical protein HRH25_05165 [Flavisolibacter sp. BT320]|nr:hypothetical protein [Flavisolibacter longurius]
MDKSPAGWRDFFMKGHESFCREGAKAERIQDVQTYTVMFGFYRVNM